MAAGSVLAHEDPSPPGAGSDEPSSRARRPRVGALPGGTVTFLFTDVEGSTALLNQHPDAYRRAVQRHHALLAAAVTRNGGTVFETVGDAVYAAFARPTDAVAAALDGQLALHREPWGDTGPLRVRMGLHLGEVELQGDHYFGAALYRCARIMAAAHGGQVVLSEATTALVRDAVSDGVTLRDLGEHRLGDLQRPERIYQLVAPRLPDDFPPLRTLNSRRHNLPVQPTPFVAREHELQCVRERLLRPDVRLLTLTGPGGSGKTRLALEAAAELLGHFEDGVFFVPLAPVADAGLVGSAIAQALGVRESGGRKLVELVVEHLAARHLLLVLDNFEHLLAASPSVEAVLAACPALKVMVASRAPLHLPGEQEFPVPPLALPDPARLPSVEALAQYDAVALLLQRARAVRPDFALTPQNAAAVAAICARLDGLPLAIELAAAWVKILTPQTLLARLASRALALTGGALGRPERHQTLRRVIDWSHDLLAAEEQTLFWRLAVFAGEFTLEAAEVVCSGGPGAEVSDQSEDLGPRPSALGPRPRRAGRPCRARGQEPRAGDGRRRRRQPLRVAGDDSPIRARAAGGER